MSVMSDQGWNVFGGTHVEVITIDDGKMFA